MRIARWTHAGGIGEGFVIGDGVVAFPRGLTVADVLAAGLAELPALAAEVEADPAASALPLIEVELLAPLVPASVRDFVAFEEHVEGVTASVDGASHVADEWYTYPTFYFTNPHSIIATGEEVRPPATERLDFELEVGAVIGGIEGSDGRDLTPAEGAAHIFGYTIFNDWSARDVQGREMKVRLGPAKGKDFATTLGPWITTADEFGGLVDDEGFLAIRVEVFVNGERVGHDLLSNMGWPFGELVAYASRDSRVVPGDVLGSGTAGNGGCLAELWGRAGELTPPPLAAGDEVVMRVEGIGEIRNTVGRARPVPGIPPARTRSRARERL
ncbi:2-keto-4-pentenoate hydratase/2-oxohepta-3-ene-1,7-dioic acid hydratase in catechol pathway [Agromyces flavus]|uniref:2-keto-4-pentenoate hydratase/2-oxohepta-3-ene-1,7-dioic acid hydratase (Catechol pathway) n=1 Tax=Agromyces flavus TaxID=589382 RepID=A0A1H1NZY1_9MICO|nr:fumarylacetoacetate hydrolase family protein [Agromyces flavus]MCP2368016.1 2-keto-4-pentenoate hydratase/2-oxohepta-3-ene-1,7-dioic acid hydratase in catechol pathway [Agromyces flavus]GGI47477.1 hydroxylase [Agromyces flavus]SDS04335.1 2-keto-4-pentenoate hydratase/2-oxohepta-3-ene-1,7-dioic acid hydratase (catechol pathway) [Agromyces flavus]